MGEELCVKRNPLNMKSAVKGTSPSKTSKMTHKPVNVLSAKHTNSSIPLTKSELHQDFLSFPRE